MAASTEKKKGGGINFKRDQRIEAHQFEGVCISSCSWRRPRITVFAAEKPIKPGPAGRAPAQTGEGFPEADVAVDDQRW